MEHTAESIGRLIQSHPYAYANEDELQAGIAGVLAEDDLTPRREVRLSDRDRLDVLVDLGPRTLGIEVKIAGAAGDVRRQLLRYAASERVDELMLVTTVRRHLACLPDEIGGKPLTRVLLRGGL
ncbi:MAG: hypothetical protein V7603_5104 [Micromonosporaceae bacterium]